MNVTSWKKWLALPLFFGFIYSQAAAQIPMGGDLVFGVDSTTGTDTLELVRGPAAMNGGMAVPDFWDNSRVASVAFDNFGGTLHNANGNLLALDFGAPASTGSIYSLSTTDPAVTSGQLIGDTAGTGGMGLSFQTRLSSISVSPDNTKVAVQGYDPGNVIVYDYTAGDTKGAGASLSGARDTAPFLTPTDTQGVAWLDNNTLVAFDSQGSVWTVNATTMATTFEAFIDTMPIGSDYSSLYYNPDVSPMLWAGYSGFDGMASQSRIFVIDPSDFSLQHTVDVSTSGESIREMAFDSNGNLYYATFGSNIEVLVGAAANPTTIANDSGLDWYTSPTFDAFPGMDIGFGGSPPPIDCDFNDDTACDGADIDMLTMDIANGTNDVANLDIDGSGTVDLGDVDEWLTQAGAMNLLSGNSYLDGDANLDGNVDGQDFVVWNTNKFTTTGKWTLGDFNASGPTDGADFVIWNTNKFMSADGFSAVPEPSGALLALIMGCCLSIIRRR